MGKCNAKMKVQAPPSLLVNEPKQAQQKDQKQPTRTKHKAATLNPEALNPEPLALPVTPVTYSFTGYTY